MKGLALILALVCSASAQTITGSISGTINDPSALAVAGAEVTLTQTTTGVQRKAQTTAAGDFVFNSVAPGVYSVAVEAPGFKKLEQTEVHLSANERLSVGVLTMQVGSLTDSVTVQAEGTAVQVSSAERSGVITSSQVENLMI